MRKGRECTLKRELEGVKQKLRCDQEQEKTLHKQIGALIQEIQLRRKSGKFDREETYSQILEQLTRSLKIAETSSATQQKNAQELQNRLKRAIQERKIIEKIKEKHYTSWRTKEIQAEGALLDETARPTPFSFK